MVALPKVIFECIKKSFEGVHWGAKMYWISPALLWNSAVVTTLVCIFKKVRIFMFRAQFSRHPPAFSWHWFQYNMILWELGVLNQLYQKCQQTDRYVLVRMQIISVFRPTPYDTYFEIKIVSTNELKHAFEPINTNPKLIYNSQLYLVLLKSKC